MSYHHGSLRETLLEAAANAVAQHGVAALSLRALAREAGVSHTAPRHHFGDKRGLVTALAATGYELLAERLLEAGDDFLEMGVAYVRFALECPGHFAVMYQPELVDEADAQLIAARARTREALVSGSLRIVDTREDSTPPALPPAALLAWSASHGLANLALTGTLGRLGHGASVDELTDTARRALNLLGSS